MILKVQKNIDVMRKLILVLSLIIAPVIVWSQGLKTDGKKIVDQNDNEVLLRGLGLGGWMLMEGYMMQSSDVADTQHEFKARLIELIGEEKTDEFYDAWLVNHVIKADVDSLAKWGFNSIRLPMHYDLFTLPIEDEPISGQNTWLEKGFVMVDSLLHWCEVNNMYLILDLHAAPGGQGYNAAISDYDDTKPSLWESQENKDKTVALWGKLAKRYKDEPWIGGYDLLNEVNWNLPGNAALKSLYVEITNTIRAVDSNHIIFIEGNWFANDFSGLTPPWDDNMAYSFHKYWNYNDQGSVDWVIELSDNYNVPLWMGEGGENSNVWFTDAISLLEENKIGWSFWPMKRIETIVSPFSILFTQGYKDVLNYWRNQGPKPTDEVAFASMMELANNSNSFNCVHQKDVPDAMRRQVATTETKPYSEHTIPGIVFMSDFDLGPLNYAYYDTDVANYSLSTGEFQAWNSGWVYRNDAVDIETNNDAVNSNGFHVGFVQKGEWINYTVQIAEAAIYSAKLRIASQSTGGQFHLALDGEDVTATYSVSSTGGWTTFTDFLVTDILLPEGEHVLTMWFDNNTAFNISSIEFTKTGSADEISLYALNGQTGSDEKSIEVVVNQELLPESLDGSLDNFSISVNGDERTISSVTMDENGNRTIILSTEDYFVYTDKIKVSYDGTGITSQTGKVLETFTDLEIRNTLIKRQILPKKIQAEDFYFNSGFGIEETTDVGGGYNIGYSNPGDYADYLIYTENDKYYQLKIRTAAQNASGNIGFYLVDEDGAETELREVTTPKTGGWQTWETISTSVFIPKGAYTLRMRIISGEMNFNWYEFDMIDAVDDESDLSEFEVLLYPNPVSNNQLFINVGDPNQNLIKIDVYSITGKLVSSKSYPLIYGIAEVDISAMSKGAYIVKMSTKVKTYNSKFIRQ